MPHDGCAHHAPFDGTDIKFRRILWLVILINAAMFIIEMLGGAAAGSQALKADALDFLADTATYSLSLAVIGRSLETRNRAAKIKAVSLLLIGSGILVNTIWECLIRTPPDAPVMGGIGFLALLANVASVVFLLPWRDGDANIRSVWLCSRNDAIGNAIVMLAALGVFGTGSAWPDLIVALVMSGLFLSSAIQIMIRTKTAHTAHHDHNHS